MALRKILVLLSLIVPLNLTFAQAPTTPLSKFLLKGYTSTVFEKAGDENSNFETGFSPIFLWKHGDNLFFESELEFEVEDEGVNIGLEYAQLFYFFNDYVMLGVGKFLSPVNPFSERLHPAWINKLPDMPYGLSAHAGVPLLAGTQMGFQLRGGIPVGPTKFTYALFLSNGPSLIVEDSLAVAQEGVLGRITSIVSGQSEGHLTGGSGLLDFNNFKDNNDDKAIGGRIGLFLLPRLEIGYGFQTAKVGTKGTEFEDVKATNHTVDVNYVGNVGGLKGKIDIRAQWVWLQIDNPNIHPLEFENNSNAGYAQLAYQPNGVESSFFRNLEFVLRFDRLDRPDTEEAPFSVDIDRYSVGINYWVSSSSVFKFAFESATSNHPDGDSETESKFLAQFALGF